MFFSKKSFLALLAWISTLVLIGWIIGLLTKSNVATWYPTLIRSPLTPPNYVFAPVWTALYATIGTVGWFIWRCVDQKSLKAIKTLFVVQLILNWSWSPIFFSYHLTGAALVCLAAMIALVALIIIKTYQTLRLVALLLAPYFLWLLLAFHLNYYIWMHN